MTLNDPDLTRLGAELAEGKEQDESGLDMLDGLSEVLGGLLEVFG